MRKVKGGKVVCLNGTQNHRNPNLGNKGRGFEYCASKGEEKDLRVKWDRCAFPEIMETLVR